MLSAIQYRLAGALLMVITPLLLSAALQRKIQTAKGETMDTPVPHQLSYWTSDPLKLDRDQDLSIGYRANDGKLITSRDYKVNQQITHLGAIDGFNILQILTTIHARPRVIASNLATADPFQWKSMLVQYGNTEQYVEIYRLQAGGGLYEPFKPATIYGNGPNTILGTYDPDTGNGGGCDDGYWWFDQSGADKAIPKNGRYFLNCFALHPEQSELESWVQKKDAVCHACGGLGHIYAKYKIEHGAAIPVSIRFVPEAEQ
jgi:hypothetical protein